MPLTCVHLYTCVGNSNTGKWIRRKCATMEAALTTFYLLQKKVLVKGMGIKRFTLILQRLTSRIENKTGRKMGDRNGYVEAGKK